MAEPYLFATWPGFLYFRNPQDPNPQGSGHLIVVRDGRPQSAIQCCTIGTRAPSKAIVGAH